MTDQTSIAVLLCNHIVSVTREYTGRGPTRARAHVTDDLVTIVLQDTLGKGERSLVEDGRRGEVLAMRQAFQETMGPVFIEGVERILDRRVLAFLSANRLDPDIAIENFVLHPVGG